MPTSAPSAGRVTTPISFVQPGIHVQLIQEDGKYANKVVENNGSRIKLLRSAAIMVASIMFG
jgi:hypothetical protein